MARKVYFNNSLPQPQFELNTNSSLNQCDPKDVISLNSEKWVSIQKLKKIILDSFNRSGIQSISDDVISNSELGGIQHWFKQGEACEILRAGSPGWKKGKIKINVTLEFIPDESDEVEEQKSPLDDIR
ncbi:MAG: KGK domain-containing protein, partial [Cyanobacteria bacterium P01_G01_bin.49]